MRGGKQKRKSLEIPTPDYRMRRGVLLAGLACGMLAVLVSAVYRQILSTEELQHKGQALYLKAKMIPVRRGEIRDRHAEPLALSAPVYSVKVDPRQLPPNAEVVKPLVKLLGLSPAALDKRLESYGSRSFVYLKRGVSKEIADQVIGLGKKYRIDAFNADQESRRYYPGGEVTAHIVGLTNTDETGIEGMELAYNNWLTGRPGKRRVVLDARQRVVEEVEGILEPHPGESLTLSLDRRLQFLSYRELKRAVLTHKAKGGSAVILDPGTGEVLAMVNQPSYNPHDRRQIKKDKSLLRNRASFNVFEPGSTMKPFVVAAALEHGLVRSDTMVETAPGYIRVGRNKVSDHRNYGTLDVSAVLTKSSNVGIAKLAWMLEPEVMWRFFQAVGVGEKTNSGFPGERSGVLHDYSTWSPFVQATNAFGYGLSVTTLQLARAYAVLAADGLMRPVSLLKLDRAPEGRRVMSAETARSVRAMLETVVSDEGTARQASVEGYRVAGKTGTAKVAIAGGYAKKRYRAVFAGMLPASAPRLVMVVLIDEPSAGKFYGGQVAAPVFSHVMSGAMRLLNVPPDDMPGPDARLADRGGVR